MKNTPGPWEIVPGYARSIQSKIGVKVASATNSAGAPPIKRPSKDEVYANARLIAAAPELLLALETIRAVVMGTSPIKEQIIEATCDSAIRKAKGE